MHWGDQKGGLIGFNRACLAPACLCVWVQASWRMFVCTHMLNIFCEHNVCAFCQSSLPLSLTYDRDPTEIRCYLWPLLNNKRKYLFVFWFPKSLKCPPEIKKRKKVKPRFYPYLIELTFDMLMWGCYKVRKMTSWHRSYKNVIISPL